MGNQEPDWLTVEELQEELKKYGPKAAVVAQEGVIIFLDTDEGGTELGRIDAPGG